MSEKLKAWWNDLNPKAKQFFYILGGLIALGIVLSVVS